MIIKFLLVFFIGFAAGWFCASLRNLIFKIALDRKLSEMVRNIQNKELKDNES